MKISKELINEKCQKIEAQAIAWRRDIHRYPEMANQEKRTSALVSAHLKNVGVDIVRDHLAGGTGVMGVIIGGLPGPTIALRADMDAQATKEETPVPFRSEETCKWGENTIPVMHSCGHDVHTAILMAAAQVLVELKEYIHGNVVLVFQPAEEGPSPGWQGDYGAKLFMQEDFFNEYRPDAMFTLHIDPNQPIGTAGEIGYKPGQTCMGISAFTIKVKGAGGHGAKPWLGVDALLPAANILQQIQNITTRNVNPSTNPVVCTIGQLYGGTKFNVIAEDAVLAGGCRYTDYSTKDMLEHRISEVAESCAKAGGAEASVIWDMRQPPNINNIDLVEIMSPKLKALLGEGKVHVCEERGFKFPDDFAHFSIEIPSIYAALSVAPDEGIAENVSGLHTPTLLVNEKGILGGIKAHVAFALSYGAE